MNNDFKIGFEKTATIASFGKKLLSKGKRYGKKALTLTRQNPGKALGAAGVGGALLAKGSSNKDYNFNFDG